MLFILIKVNKKMKNQDISDMVIFGGSLEELNEYHADLAKDNPGLNKEYKVATDELYVVKYTGLGATSFDTLKKDVKERGHDGLIHASYNSQIFSDLITGVPVKLIEK
jgi:hypothetical protein